MGSRIVFIPQTTTPPAAPSGKIALYIDGTPAPKLIDENGTTYDMEGPKGDDGTDGSAATVSVDSTVTGSPGTNASVTNVGTSSAASFKFTIPRGDKGETGSDGADGSPATIAVGTTTTSAPGTNADVSNSGTSSAAVFDFTIPRGDDGAKGDKGDTGDTGPAGADGHILDVSGLGSITGSITIDLSSAHVFTATLTGDVTLAWSGLPASGTMTDRVLILTQDATGGHTITWPSGTKWPGGLAYTTDAANIETAVGLLVDSAGNTRAFPVEDFS